MPKKCTCGHSAKYPDCDGSHKALDSAMDNLVPLILNKENQWLYLSIGRLSINLKSLIGFFLR